MYQSNHSHLYVIRMQIANLRQMGGNYRAGGGGGGGWMHHSHESGLPFGLASIGAIAGLWQRRTAPRGNARSRANTDPLMLSLGMMDRYAKWRTL